MDSTNRYTRLKSLSDFGYDINWEKLSEKKVLIIGVGGVGSIVAEMLARCGIGELNIIDLDIVEEVNLNRLFYLKEQIGEPKAEVVKKMLSTVNPDVHINSFMTDVCSNDFEGKLDELITQCNLTFSCLDNLPARLYINQKCVALDKAYVDTGATRSGLGGYIHLVLPRKNACYSCTGSLDLGSKEKGESCTASLPSTIAIIASIATEISLKHLLEFGKIPDYIGFNALDDVYLRQKTPRDPNCYVCGDKKYSKTEKESSLKQIQSITEGKSVDELIEELGEEKRRIEDE